MNRTLNLACRFPPRPFTRISTVTVYKLIANDPLELAQDAALQGDWSRLNDYLQHLLSDARGSSPQASYPDLVEDRFAQVIQLALEVLEEGEFQDRWEVAKLFPSLGERAIAPLISLLQNPALDPDMRWFIARILGEFRHPDVVPALIEVLKTSTQDELGDMAATALAGFGELAIAPLTELLNQPQSRLLAVRTLSHISHPAVLTVLLPLLQDPQPAIRLFALDALSRFQDPSIVRGLIQGLSDPSAQVRRTAVMGVGLRAALFPPEERVPLIHPLLTDRNLEVCRQAALALGRLGTEEAAIALGERLRSPHTPPVLQRDLIRTLGWMGTPAAIQSLLTLLDSATNSSFPPDLYPEVVAVLGRVEGQPLQTQACHGLLTVLQSNHPDLTSSAVRQMVAWSLGQLVQENSIEALIQLLADDHDGVRFHAITALKQINSAQTYQALTDLAQTPHLAPDLMQGVAIALQEW